MSEIFSVSSSELEHLSNEIDRQLAELQNKEFHGELKTSESSLTKATPKQKTEIEKLTGAPANSLLQKLNRVIRKDLCEEGGLLKEQWNTLRYMKKKDLISIIGTGLTVIGVTEGAALLVVPASVIILHLGARTFCEEYGNE